MVGGAEADRPARQVQPARFLDQPFFQQAGHAGGGVHPAHLLDEGAGHRLVVSDDGQRLHRRLGQGRGPPVFQGAADIGAVLVFGGQLPVVPQAQQGQPAVRLHTAGLQGFQPFLHQRLGPFQGGGQLVGAHRVPVGEQHGFQHRHSLSFLHLFPPPAGMPGAGGHGGPSVRRPARSPPGPPGPVPAPPERWPPWPTAPALC